MESVLSLNNPFAHPFGVLHRRLRLKVSGFKTEVRAVLKRDLEIHECEHFTGVQEIYEGEHGLFASTDTVIWVGFVFDLLIYWAC
jgi:hypothetical protein